MGDVMNVPISEMTIKPIRQKHSDRLPSKMLLNVFNVLLAPPFAYDEYTLYQKKRLQLEKL